MYHFIRNEKTVIIPGVEKHIAGTFYVNQSYYETPYGLVFPGTELSLALIRFLRYYDPMDKKTYEMATADSRFYVAHLLNNQGEFEFLSVEVDLIKGASHHIVEVVSLPSPEKGWQVECLSDSMKAHAASDIIQKMTAKQAVQWLDVNSANRFQRPITISIPTWVATRKAEGFGEKRLLNNTFKRAVAEHNK